MEAESRDLLTVEQAANYLQLSQSSIRSYIRQGKLKAFRVAGKRKVLIPRDELLKLLEPARGDQMDELMNGGSNDVDENAGENNGRPLPPRPGRNHNNGGK
jgi:excisionase family DNA binding protein